MIQKNWQELIKPDHDKQVIEQIVPGYKAKMVIEPLERGFGFTLGNALRRILLSSLQGGAVTAIKIAGVQHEFSSIPGVREDVTEIVLNIKNLALKVDAEGPQHIYLNATGPGVITAKQIVTNHTIEVMNPDLVIGAIEEFESENLWESDDVMDLAEELNVKKVRLLDTAGEAMDFQLNPLPKQLGQKYGKLFPQLRGLILKLEPMAAGRKLLAGENIEVELDGTVYAIQPDEVEVRANAHSGYTVATEGANIAALVTDLTPELVKEGLAREFVRHVQDLRKTAGLEISDRIEVCYQADALLAEAIRDNAEYICNETLCLSMQEAPVPADWAQVSDSFDNVNVTVGLKKA